METKKEGIKMFKNKYRYVCPACTNIAFHSQEKTKFFQASCNSCFKLLKECDLNNYIKI